MTTHAPRIGAAAVLIPLLLGACHHAAAPSVAASPSGMRADDGAAARLRADSIARAENARRDSLARVAARADSIRRAADASRLAGAQARQSITAPVHFAFDESEIESSERALLDEKAAILQSRPALRLRIEGNADERGSDEYNLALGMRRAAIARRYLIEHGVDAGRLAVTSNGEEHPLCQEHEESCWAQNRRDDFIITAGDKQIAMNSRTSR